MYIWLNLGYIKNMKNKSPYEIGQRTLYLLVKIDHAGIFAQDALEGNDSMSAEQYGRYKLMVDLAAELYEAIDADELASQIDPQLG